MITLSSTQLYAWIAGFIWPLSRILGLISTAPLFSNVSVPATIKIALGASLAIIVAPSVPALPATDPMSLAGLAILTQQLLIGIAMGFSIRIVFGCAEMAGEMAGMTMGLGFATFFDPQSEGHSSAISQFFSLITLMIYVTTNLHLVLLSTLVDSFRTLPISSTAMGIGVFQEVALWGGTIFSTGVQLALPIIAALLITNLALGILTRAAPQLNIFGIGFPITISVGLIMIAAALPYMTAPLDRLFNEGIEVVQRLSSAPVPQPPGQR
jgi:flagellar biosynthesis protein FliR